MGLGREEMERIFLALKHLVESQQLLHCRLWGRILGTEGSYVVAEAAAEEHSIDEGAEEDEREGDTQENQENEVRKRKILHQCRN